MSIVDEYAEIAKRLAALKGQSASHPLFVLADNPDGRYEFRFLPDARQSSVQKFWIEHTPRDQLGHRDWLLQGFIMHSPPDVTFERYRIYRIVLPDPVIQALIQDWSVIGSAPTHYAFGRDFLTHRTTMIGAGATTISYEAMFRRVTRPLEDQELEAVQDANLELND